MPQRIGVSAVAVRFGPSTWRDQQWSIRPMNPSVSRCPQSPLKGPQWPSTGCGRPGAAHAHEHGGADDGHPAQPHQRGLRPVGTRLAEGSIRSVLGFRATPSARRSGRCRTGDCSATSPTAKCSFGRSPSRTSSISTGCVASSNAASSGRFMIPCRPRRVHRRVEEGEAAAARGRGWPRHRKSPNLRFHQELVALAGHPHEGTHGWRARRVPAGVPRH
jgi:hypothetical protein